MGGFDTPILHGLCTFGHVGRAVLRTYCDDDPTRFKSFEARFSGVVFPGETIVTEMWKADAKQVILRARVGERPGDPVLTSAAVTIG